MIFKKKTIYLHQRVRIKYYKNNYGKAQVFALYCFAYMSTIYRHPFAASPESSPMIRVVYYDKNQYSLNKSIISLKLNKFPFTIETYVHSTLLPQNNNCKLFGNYNGLSPEILPPHVVVVSVLFFLQIVSKQELCIVAST